MLLKDKKELEQNREIAYNYYVQQGLTPIQSSALVGNFIQESGLSPSAKGDGGISHGIAQWNKERLQKLRDINGFDNSQVFGNQLNFAWQELNSTHKTALNKLKAAKTIEEATLAVSDNFERPNKKYAQNDNRIKYAVETYNKFNDGRLLPTQMDNSGNTLTNLQTQQQNTNLAEDESVAAEPKEIQQAKQEISQKEIEQNFLADYQAGKYNLQQPVQQPQKVLEEPQPQQDLIGEFAQISQFVDSPSVLQQGGKIQTPREFYLEYLQSPKYKERLINAGYKDVDKEIQTRLRNIQNTKILEQNGAPGLIEQTYNKIMDVPYSTQGSMYDPGTNTIISDYPTDLKNGSNIKKYEPVTHEFGHAELEDNSGKKSNNPFWQSSRLNKRDENELVKRLTIPEDKPLEGEDLHNIKPEENKSDLNTLRYQLKKEGVYDAGKNNLTKEQLRKAKSSFIKNRLLKNYSEDDLIWLMNNIAQNEDTQTEIQTVQQGGEINPRGLWDNPNSPVIIPSTQITTYPDPITGKPLNMNILGISNTGHVQIMKPNKNYNFNGQSVYEIPLNQ